MEYFANLNRHEPISSKIENDISTILSSKQYNSLKDPYHFQADELKHKTTRFTSKKLILFCDLLKRLMSDHSVWEKYEIPEYPFYSLRLRYRIVGNVLKAIFYVHERNKKTFLAYFKKEFVKTFTFPASGNQVKFIILKPVKNVKPDIDDRRPPLQDLSVRPSARSEIRGDVLSTENGGVLGNIPDDVPQQQPVTTVPSAEVPSDLPIRNNEELAMIQNMIYLEEQKRRWAAAHRIEVAEDPEPTEANRGRNVLATSSETRNEEYNELQMVTAFLRESGLGVEGHEHITTHAELQRILDAELGQQFAQHQAVVRPARRSILSQESDDVPRHFTVQAEVHEVPAGLRIPQPTSPIVVQAEVHEMPAGLRTPQPTSPIVVQAEVHEMPAGLRTPQPTSSIVVQAEVHEIPAGLRTPQPTSPTVSTVIPTRTVTHVQTDIVAYQTPARLPATQLVPIPPVQATQMDEDQDQQQPVQENIPVLPISHPRQEERAVEREAAIHTLTQENAAERTPARMSIAEMLFQGAPVAPRFLDEIMRAMEQPGPIFGMPPIDMPIKQEQKASTSTSPRRSSVVLEDSPKKKKPAAKRKKYIFYSNLVVTRRLNKNYRSQAPVRHVERMRQIKELIRRPSLRFAPFDRYETDERNLDFFRRFHVPDGGSGDSENLMSNLLCQYFLNDDLIVYDEENEVHDRIARIRASIRLRPGIPQPSGIPLHTEEHPNQNLEHFLQVPVPKQPIAVSKSPVPQAMIQPSSVGTGVVIQPSLVETEAGIQPSLVETQATIQPSLVETQAAPTEQVIESEEVIPRKRSRKTLDQNTMVMAQMPLHEQIPSIEPTAGTTVPVDAMEQQVEEVVRPRRKRVSNEDVLNRLFILWVEKSGRPVSFSELCADSNNDRFILASTFSALLRLHGMKMLKLRQEPEGSWSRDSVLIYWV